MPLYNMSQYLWTCTGIELHDTFEEYQLITKEIKIISQAQMLKIQTPPCVPGKVLYLFCVPTSLLIKKFYPTTTCVSLCALSNEMKNVSIPVLKRGKRRSTW